MSMNSYGRCQSRDRLDSRHIGAIIWSVDRRLNGTIGWLMDRRDIGIWPVDILVILEMNRSSSNGRRVRILLGNSKVRCRIDRRIRIVIGEVLKVSRGACRYFNSY